MCQYVLCLTKGMPLAWAMGKRLWDDGIGSNDQDCALEERISRKARASEAANVRRCWTKTRLWRRHRPRSEQAGILHYNALEGGSRAFA